MYETLVALFQAMEALLGGLFGQVRLVDVYEVWNAPKGGMMEKYSDAPSKAKADEVAAALKVLGGASEVRGPVPRLIIGPAAPTGTTTTGTGTTGTGTTGTTTEPPETSLAWGNKVTKEFRDKVREIAGRLGMDANHLMAVMAFETGYTFDPAVKNAAGSGATGLIQFMPTTAVGLGTTTDDLAKMTAVEQLAYVEKYLTPYKNKMKTVEDAYMAVFTPSAIGKGSDHVLYSKPSTAYTQNAGLDTNKDDKITVGEAAGKVSAALTKGNQDPNVFPVLKP